jgi:nitrite reductase (NADH) large subunit
MTARIVVIGAGPAGTRCAELLARGGRAVTLVGGEPGPPYDRVALSKYLAGDVDAAALVTHAAPDLAALGIRHIPGVMAAEIDRGAACVRLVDGRRLPYDRLVLALGSEPVRLNLAGAEGLDGIVAYRTLDDVAAMLRAAATHRRGVVIGGGLLGLEAAVGLARRGMHVTVLHAVDRLMERQLDGEAAARLRAHLARSGVISVLSARSVAVEGEGRISAVRLEDGTRVPADLLVMAVGIRPRTPLARAAGLAVARGVVVDAAMRTSDPSILAIGECAEFEGQCCGLVAPAFAQAETAARALLGEPARYVRDTDSAVLKIAGAPVWSAGEIGAEDTETIVLDEPGGAYRALKLRDGRLVGAILWGDTADAPFYRNLIRREHDVSKLRSELVFGAAFSPLELRS